MRKNTKLIHGYPVVDPVTGASSIPKVQASTYHKANIESTGGYFYSRVSNPTVDALEAGIAAIDHAKYGLAFASGMAAINAALFMLNQGEHIVLGKSIYGGTYQTVTTILNRFGIEATFICESDMAQWEAAIRPNTKMFYIETPSNPLLTITDIRAVCQLAKKHGIITLADNTFMSPLSQDVLSLGVDISLHSATKFINGHSDVIAGLITLNDECLYKKLKELQINLGATLGVEDAWLILRGMKTMGIRLEKSIATAQTIAEYLTMHPKVKNVYYPGLTTHPNHDLHSSQASDGGAVLSFELNTVQATMAYFKNCQIPIVAVSLGGVESIASYPWQMSHGAMPEEARFAAGVTPTLVRLSCGIEDVEDLIEDFEHALACIDC